jgi:hypothetical protein
VIDIAPVQTGSSCRQFTNSSEHIAVYDVGNHGSRPFAVSDFDIGDIPV